MNETVGPDVSPVSEYLGIIKRRKWLVVSIAVLSIVGAATVAFTLPPKYQSTATILIEEPAISDDIAKTGGNFADQRLQLIQQRVMTTAKLVEVIDRLGLYADVRQLTPATVLADDMRSRIAMRLVGSETDGKNSRQAKASTAFTVSYTSRDPATAQRVTSELVALYLGENERTQRARAVGTAGFLSGESSRLAIRIKELETQLAEFKTTNAGMLPEEMEFNVQLLDRTQNQLLELMRQAQAARERQAFLQTQILTLEPQAPVSTAAPETLSPKARLRLLKAQYTTLLSKYGDKHPDVVRIRRQIDAITGAGGGQQQAVDLEQLEAQLLSLSQKYGEAHPEVVRLKRQISAAQSAMPADPGEDAPDNPVYVQTLGQLNAVNADLSMVQSQVAALQAKMSAVEARIAKTPEIERSYVALKREYDSAVAKLTDLRERENEADLAKNLETEQMGQRLSLIEPPPMPTTPVSPNRPAILLLGIIAGLAGSIGIAVLIDSMDGRIYGPRRLAAIVGASPLALVPRIATTYSPASRGPRYAMVALSLLIMAGILLVDMDISSVGEVWSAMLDRVN